MVKGRRRWRRPWAFFRSIFQSLPHWGPRASANKPSDPPSSTHAPTSHGLGIALPSTVIENMGEAIAAAAGVDSSVASGTPSTVTVHYTCAENNIVPACRINHTSSQSTKKAMSEVQGPLSVGTAHLESSMRSEKEIIIPLPPPWEPIPAQGGAEAPEVSSGGGGGGDDDDDDNDDDDDDDDDFFTPTATVVTADPNITIEVLAALDSQARASIMKKSIQEQAKLILEPCNLVLLPLGSTLNNYKISVLGIVRDVDWYFAATARTYTTDFYVVDIEEFDVVIGQPTIKQYGLLRKHTEIPRRVLRRL
ncbi:retropepsin-like aspartic protease [Aspergillus aculeatinus CBS 121060]|uniref:Uncharacterized protein n=1 Tax=Aspergillus aculeatinus CBS 121060 TaxID=1448322 RepID=A0ACD1H1Y0_9EURO|nr:hypothetical protein BO66DRAFT_153634 [Aspergillus aculeatinus CBS 121060]RAH67570.1 hypothetical protein BO66DRAFT_153634 [Aspergillus aculeatinus CBS 121060]